MKSLIILLIGLLSISYSFAQHTPYITYAELEKIMQQKDDTLRIINLWATWCKPCIEELPDFEKIAAEYTTKKVKVILVSMDFKSKIETQLKPFIIKNNIQSQVVVLDQTDSNTWINKLSPDWSGAIPATIITLSNKNIRLFHEGSYTYNDLHQIIEENVQP